VAQFTIELFHLQGTSGNLIELLGVGAVGAFDGAVEFGGASREHKPVQAALLTGLFELGGKLRAAIDLDGANGERHAVLQSVEELSGTLRGSARVGLHHILTRDQVARGELFQPPKSR
jgi:hypothetical protein